MQTYIRRLYSLCICCIFWAAEWIFVKIFASNLRKFGSLRFPAGASCVHSARQRQLSVTLAVVTEWKKNNTFSGWQWVMSFSTAGLPLFDSTEADFFYFFSPKLCSLQNTCGFNAILGCDVAPPNEHIMISFIYVTLSKPKMIHRTFLQTSHSRGCVRRSVNVWIWYSLLPTLFLKVQWWL